MKKNIYKSIAIASLGICLILAANCAKASNVNPAQNFDLNLNKSLSLIKSADSPTVYLVANGKKHKILTAEIFTDYGFDWNDINIISEEQLKQYPQAKVAKSPDSSKVYYINESINKKKFIPNEIIFLAYGNKWEDIITISKKDLDSYSDINVIKSSSDPKIYELKDGVKNAILNPEEFTTKGYKWNEIVLVKDIELDYYPTKMAVNGEDVIVAGVEYDENEYEDEDFKDEIFTDNRYLSIQTIKTGKEVVVPSGSIPAMIQLKLTAGIEQPVNIKALKITRAKGISSIETIIITDSEGNLLGEGIMPSKNYVNIRLKPEIYIAPNNSQIINIKATVRHEDYISHEKLFVESAKDIQTDGYVQGVFPIAGDNFKVIPGDSLIGKLEAGTVVVSDGLRGVHIGETDYLVTKFVFSETTGNEDVHLKRLKITNVGSGFAKMANVDLVDQNNKVIATVKNPTSSSIVFDMETAPFVIPKGLSRTLGVKVDIIDGARGNIKFEIQKENDILATGKKYLFDLTVVNKEDDSFPIGRGNGKYFNRIEIDDVDIAIYKSDLSAVGGLVAGSKEQSLGVFNIRTNGSTINLQAIDLQIINGGDIELKGDLIIREYKTKKILGEVPAHSMSLGSKNISLDIYPKIESKKTFSFEVLGTVSENATILNTYQVKISGIDFQMPGSSSEHYFNYDIYGNTLSVKCSNLSVVENKKYNDKKIAANKTKVLIGSFVLQASVAEKIVVDSLNITEAPGYQTINFSEGYNNLRIYINTKNYKTYQSPSGNSFILDTPFSINAGKSVAVNVYVDATPLVDADKIKLEINSVNAHGSVSKTTPAISGEGVQSFVTEFKQNRLVIKKNMEMEDVVIQAGKANQKIASFSFENKGVESITIKNFTLAETESSNEISYNNGYSNLRTSNGKKIAKPIAGGNVFGGFTIKPGATVIINISLSTNESTVGDEFNLVFKDIKISGGVEVEGHYVMGQSVRVVGN